MSDKRADLAGPGIGDYAGTGESPAAGLPLAAEPRRIRSGPFSPRRITSRRTFARAQPHDGDGAADRGRGRAASTTTWTGTARARRSSSTSPTTANLHPLDAQVVQAATKWKRVALKRFGMNPGEGLCTDMRAVRKDYFLDHDHSVYVDQWDWEQGHRRRAAQPRFLKGTVNAIWKVLVDAEGTSCRSSSRS